MRTKLFYIASVVLILFSCQPEKKEVMIQFTANGKNYEVSGKQKTFLCEITFDTFTNKNNHKSDYDFLRDRSMTFNYFSHIEEDEFVMNFFFKMCSDESFPDSAKVIYEDFTCKDNTAGYKSIIKAKNEIGGRFKFLKGGGTNDKFHLDIKVVKDLANGTFSGELTNDINSNKLIIKNGVFKNVPFKRNALD